MSGGLLGLGLILAGLVALFLAPWGLGAIRIGGIGLAWWYGGVVGPVLGLIVTLACLPARPDDSDRSR